MQHDILCNKLSLCLQHATHLRAVGNLALFQWTIEQWARHCPKGIATGAVFYHICREVAAHGNLTMFQWLFRWAIERWGGGVWQFEGGTTVIRDMCRAARTSQQPAMQQWNEEQYCLYLAGAAAAAE